MIKCGDVFVNRQTGTEYNVVHILDFGKSLYYILKNEYERIVLPAKNLHEKYESKADKIIQNLDDILVWASVINGEVKHVSPHIDRALASAKAIGGSVVLLQSVVSK